MKKYITPINVVVALLLVGIVMQTIVIFFPSHRNQEKLELLQQQQKGIEQITQQLQKNDASNRFRDSILLDAFEKNTAARQQQLTRIKQSTNEKIDHINGTAFNADSIRRAFASN
jgi:ABC-type Na+ efflux pump permease subunit